MSAVEEVFQTRIVSEYEPEFWGFATQAEWDEALKEISERAENEFHERLIKYLHGEPHGLCAGQMVRAAIAANIVAENPELLLPENRKRLHTEIQSVYERDHTIEIRLTEKQMAAVRMMSTHEEDLPSA